MHVSVWCCSVGDGTHSNCSTRMCRSGVQECSRADSTEQHAIWVLSGQRADRQAASVW